MFCTTSTHGCLSPCVQRQKRLKGLKTRLSCRSYSVFFWITRQLTTAAAGTSAAYRPGGRDARKDGHCCWGHKHVFPLNVFKNKRGNYCHKSNGAHVFKCTYTQTHIHLDCFYFRCLKQTEDWQHTTSLHKEDVWIFLATLLKYSFCLQYIISTG